MRNCTIGIPCGATCIDRDKKCRVEFGSNVSDGLTKTSRIIKSNDVVKEYAPIPELDSHMKKNTFAIPGSKLSAEDMSRLISQAVGTQQGESQENLKRMVDFIIRDRQGLVISQDKAAYDANAAKVGKNAHSSWVNSPEFKTLMLNTHQSDKSNPVTTVKRMTSKLEELRETEERLTKKIENLQRMGNDTAATQRNLSEIREKMGEIKIAIKDPNYAVASHVLMRDGVLGKTSSNRRNTHLADEETFDRDKKIDAKIMGSLIGGAMRRRVGLGSISEEDEKKTYFLRSSLPKGSSNERVLLTYTHEIGHQVHYRSGIYDPPPDRQKMGISGYSRVSYRETFAEAFVAYVFNPGTLREVDKPLYDWVDSNFKRALQNAGSRQLVPDY